MTIQSSEQLPLVLAITGASGAVYAVRLLQLLCNAKVAVHLVISPSGAAVIQQELRGKGRTSEGCFGNQGFQQPLWSIP